MSSPTPSSGGTIFGLSRCALIGVLLFLALVLGYLVGLHPYDIFHDKYNALSWLARAWNRDNDLEHGWMIPLISAYLCGHACHRLKGVAACPSLWGLLLVVPAALLWLAAVRTHQARLAIVGIPVMLSGMVWCYWGSRAALKTAFPLFFLWLCVPLPGFQQTTVHLQLLAAQWAHLLAGCCGVETLLEGTNVSSVHGHWSAFNIVGGCSGIRSLMALLMISAAWGYLADRLSLWKRLLLGLSALPIAVVGNAVRVASIFVCAEYIDEQFAHQTWHDWSGLLFFFPVSLFLLALLHGLLAGEVPFLKRRRVIIRQANTTKTA